MCTHENIVYSINHEDIQTYASQELGRTFSEEELKLVGNKIGDHISWFDAIDTTVKSLEIE